MVVAFQEIINRKKYCKPENTDDPMLQYYILLTSFLIVHITTIKKTKQKFSHLNSRVSYAIALQILQFSWNGETKFSDKKS